MWGGGVLTRCGWCLCKKRGLGPRHREDTVKMAVCKTRREPSEETKPVNILFVDSQPPGL